MTPEKKPEIMIEPQNDRECIISLGSSVDVLRNDVVGIKNTTEKLCSGKEEHGNRLTKLETQMKFNIAIASLFGSVLGAIVGGIVVKLFM